MKNRKNIFFASAAGLTCASLLVACGSGSGGGGTTQTGVFHDSPVNGLAYNCAPSGLSGTTQDGGAFSYKSGDTCSFSLGAVNLGSAKAGAMISPIELVANGTPSDPTVLNIVQLLLTADDNNNPADGINIPGAVATAAEAATTVDISSGTFDLDVTQLIADMYAAGSGRDTLKPVVEAQAHIEGSSLCFYSGLYNGSWDNGNGGSGDWGMILFPNGTAMGIAGGYMDGEGSFSGTLTPSTSVVSLTGSYSIPDGVDTITENISATGRPTSPQNVAGTVTGDLGTDGTFSGTRFAGDVSAKYRYTGFYTGDGRGVFAIDIYDDNSVAGNAYSFDEETTLGLSGAVTGGTILNVTVANGVTATATVNLGAGTLSSATWDGSAIGVTGGTFSGGGCQLN